MKVALLIGLAILFFYSLSGLELGEKRSDDFFVTTRREPTIQERISSTFGIHANNMSAIMECESEGDPTKVNYSDSLITGVPSWGLFQINAREFEGWDDPAVNIASASAKLKSQGYGAWKNCAMGLGIL